MSFRAPSTLQSASTSGIEPARHLPIRVFLLSRSSLLRDMIMHLLKNQADISLIGAQEFSALTLAEMIASGCDVLLTDPGAIKRLNGRSRHELRRSCSNLKIVSIDMKAGIADLLSAILHIA